MAVIGRVALGVAHAIQIIGVLYREQNQKKQDKKSQGQGSVYCEGNRIAHPLEFPRARSWEDEPPRRRDRREHHAKREYDHCDLKPDHATHLSKHNPSVPPRRWHDIAGGFDASLHQLLGARE
ncbi:hypothetical protein [Bradyrhizobium sp. McL0615]|uniref:hypothetical protein n=1 Tax=Bradyrhizobium sp. McL0615 TaxID=3415673 RepID=UPI003CEABFD0